MQFGFCWRENAVFAEKHHGCNYSSLPTRARKIGMEIGKDSI